MTREGSYRYLMTGFWGVIREKEREADRGRETERDRKRQRDREPGVIDGCELPSR